MPFARRSVPPGLVRRLCPPGLLLLGFLFLSCSLDYSGSRLAEELGEEVPQTILREFVHTDVNFGRIIFVLRAREARVFPNQQETRLLDVEFTEYGPQGEVTTEGRADRAQILDQEDRIILEGGLEFFSHEQNARILAPYLEWDGNSKTLQGRFEDPVQIRREGEIDVQGRGFQADVGIGSFEFLQGVEGTWYEEAPEGEPGDSENAENADESEDFLFPELIGDTITEGNLP